MEFRTYEAFFFGPPERPLFGSYHPARGDHRRGCGVLLCPPIGWEAIAAHRAYRVLAEGLAAEGFAVLRFDYDGTGDAFGEDTEPGRVSLWLRSVELAAAQLRALSGVQTLSLFGTHLGATLAAHAAASLEAFSLVLWAPFLQGRQFLRQVKAYRALNPQRSRLPEGDEEAAGFLFHAGTAAELSKLDLLGLPTAPAPRILLLKRDETSNEDKAKDRWSSLGAKVSVGTTAGYAEMMQEPRKSVLPSAVLEQVRSWLSQAHPESAPSRTSSPNAPSTAMEGEGFTEEVVHMGPGGSLFGFLTKPRGMPQTRPAVVFLNTAMDPRIGPNRMYVSWARRLAAAGMASLRFDPRGVGDGAENEDGGAPHAYGESRLEDVRAALDFLETRDVGHQFILLGLCSGAYVAFHLGLEDSRVVGEVLINPQTFYWKAGDSLELKVRQSYKSTRFYRGALLRRETWRRLARGEIHVVGIAATLARRVALSLATRLGRALPYVGTDELRLERDFEKTLRRKTDVLLVFSASDGGLDVFESHVGRGGGRMRAFATFALHILDGPNHTFTGVQHQRELFNLVLGHWDQRFPSPSAEGPGRE